MIELRESVRPFNLISNLPEQIWRILAQRWLLWLVGGLTFWLIICAFVLDQLPAHLQSDPSEVARWMVETRLRYGSMGELFNNLGLFNLLHSRFLQVSLILTALLLLIHLANGIDTAYHLSQLAHLLKQTITRNPARGPGATLEKVAGRAIALQTHQRIYRRRLTHPLLAEELTAQLHTYLESHLGSLQQETVYLPVQEPQTEEGFEASIQVEERLLTVHHPEMAYLRILSVVGLLLTLWAVWTTAVNGWEVETNILAPGDTFRNAQHDFIFSYDVTPLKNETDKLVTTLDVTIDDVQERLSLAAGSFMRVGAVNIWTTPHELALLVSSVGDRDVLARPGQFTPSAMIGLLFPSLDSEESIILPQQRTGLRIVRIDDEDQSERAFSVEVFREKQATEGEEVGAQLIDEYYIEKEQPKTLSIAESGPVLRLDPVPSIQVEASYMPGLWLAWPAFVLALIGAIGFWRQPRYLMIQVAPWPVDRSVVVVQGNLAQDVEAVESWLKNLAGDLLE